MREHFLIYTVLNDGSHARVGRDDCDAVEQAGIIDRTLLPVLSTGKGWANSRRSAYTVTGEIKSNAATFQLQEGEVLVAKLAVCLKAKVSMGLWQWITASTEAVPTGLPPPPAWAALRHETPAATLPAWLDWWAKHVAFALMTREGW